jgi:capsid protein
MESATPSTEFQQYMKEAIQLALKALDIPFSFYDESHTNFSGSRQALILYQQSVDAKRESLRNLLNALTVWRLSLFIVNGELELPPEITTLDDIDFEWVGCGVPWIDPMKEALANTQMLNNGTTSRQRVCKANGENFYQIVDEIAAENEYLKEKGVTLAGTQLSVVANIGSEQNNPGGGGQNGNTSKSDK